MTGIDNWKKWLGAFRLRTLPLAMACILAGSLASYLQGYGNWGITLWCICTAWSLQILSNLANDLGDTQHGADSEYRIGPVRSVQSGKISISEMKKALWIWGAIALSSGVGLLLCYVSGTALWVLLAVGLLSIVAAYSYTAGKLPYGYMGLGDLSVYVFFGQIAVHGTYYLHSQHGLVSNFLVAHTVGALSVAVLNLNNMRDLASDTLAGKRTIPVRIGLLNAKRYHSMLIISALITWNVYFTTPTASWSMLVIQLSSIPLVWSLREVWRRTDPMEFDPLLKVTALSTLELVLVSWAVLLIQHWNQGFS